MPMEGSGQQFTREIVGKRHPSPNGISFTTKIISLADRARRIKNEPLKNLIYLIDLEWLRESWKRIRKGAAFGIDQVSAKEYETNLEENLSNLLIKLKSGNYRPLPVKRIYIPKGANEKRPLGLPTVEDKIVQRAVDLILSAIYEQDFVPRSFGFRQNRNAHQAIEATKSAIATRKVGWIVDADIKSFFDEMDHEVLLMFLKHRVADKSLLRLISKWLKAGVMEEGKLEKSSTGTPQGGVISPILANIYLHYVNDLWVDKVVGKHLRGELHWFRYADDVIYCFQFRNEALRFLKAIKGRMGKFKLRLNEEKTKICRFGKFAERDRKLRGERRATFNYLGFTFYNKLSRNGKYTVGTRTQSKKLSGSMNRVTKWCKENRHQPIEWQVRYLNAVLRGHYLYYGVTGNFKSIAAFYRHVVWAWQRCLSKRSQRAYIKWDKFNKILERFPLLKPYLPHAIGRQ